MRRLIKRLLLSNVVSFSQSLFNSFKSRVIGNSGVVEADSCAVTTLSNLDSKNLLQSATFVLAPSGYKSGVIYSQVPSNGNGDLTVTRATSATRVNSSGLIESVASGVPQLDYSLGGCPNFLFEPQRTNNFLYSEQFNNGWQTSKGSITSDSAIAPDGNQTADTLVGDGTGTSYVYRGVSMTNGSSYTISIYVKPINLTLFFIQSFTQGGQAVFTLTGNGLLGGVSGFITSQTITNVGNGWYRCTATMTANATASNNVGFGLQNYNGNQFYLWGAQCETGSGTSAAYPTSYIPTTSAAVTRNATSFTCSTNGLIGASGGTWFVEFKNNIPLTKDAAATTPLFIGDTSLGATNSLFIRNDASGTRLSILKRVSGSPTLLCATTTSSPKIVINWNGTICNIYVDGLKQVSSTSFTTLSMNYLNCSPIDVPYCISQMALWNTPLSEAQCIALTS